MKGTKGANAAPVVERTENRSIFYDANNELDSQIFTLENLVITLKYAALWEEHDGRDEMNGPCWMEGFEDVQAKFTVMTVRASDFRKAATIDACDGTVEQRETVTSECSILASKIFRLETLLAFFHLVAEHECVNGHSEEIVWSEGFDVLLDAIGRIRGASGEVWERVKAAGGLRCCGEERHAA